MTDFSRFLLGSVGFFFLIILPLVIYLVRRAVPSKRLVAYIFILYVLWYLPYAPIHEGCHYLAGRLAGLHATSTQFMPPFWKGDFVNGYIQWADARPSQILLSTLGPYVVDGLLVLLGCLLLRKPTTFGPFIGALILTQIFLRSVFDIVVNYVGGTFRDSGDFYHLLHGYPPLAVHLVTWTVILLGAFGAGLQIARARPEKQLAAVATPDR